MEIVLLFLEEASKVEKMHIKFAMKISIEIAWSELPEFLKKKLTFFQVAK